ncbi:uncharacterized protein LOC127137006 [Lathyrus oleraceus]|uniref:uncharacterized protein LOC127137006 n=1 Tax=Pisum sativum TaxID=3888 RepID=UPI001FC5C427|nr:uncharacterized protein LOC127137006 [Pisum sativum]
MVKTKGWEQEVILCIPHQTTIKYLCKEGGTLIGKHEDIEEKIIDFYGKLMGKAEMNLNGFDIVSMRKGNQVTIEQRNDLIMHVTETEIVKALKYIGDKRAPDWEKSSHTLSEKAKLHLFRVRKFMTISCWYELIKGYSRKGGTPNGRLQMDIHKAYDIVDHKALKTILKEIGFPRRFIGWIMLAVTTVTYRFNINGVHSMELVARRGLRQGDSISHLLLMIIMEYLQRQFNKIQWVPDFNFHSKCEKLKIINLSFADDLLLFSRGDTKSVDLMMENFDEFSKATCLVVNPHK